MNHPINSYRYVNSYIEVLSCVFMHYFYESGICNEVTFLPDERTRFILKNYNLVFKPKLGGFALAASSDKDYSNSIYRDPFGLDFEFRFTNRYFHSFTGLTIDPEVRYFLNDDQSELVEMGSGHEVREPEFDRPGISGILRINHLPNYPLLPLISENSNPFRSRKKEFLFKARHIRPVYICYVSEDRLDQFRGLLIESEGEFRGVVDFDPPSLIKTSTGLAAFKFVAKNKIPMKSFWKGSFKLQRTNQLGLYKKTLPNPNPQSIKFDYTHNTFISENFVKL